ncbi:MAG: BrnT family toxin [Terriglobia bacterium]
MLFKWSSEKAKINFKKHGISFEDATTVFGDPLSITIEDPVHSSVGDERFMTLGRSRKGRLLVVVHSEKEGFMRIISARRTTPSERRNYEET